MIFFIMKILNLYLIRTNKWEEIYKEEIYCHCISDIFQVILFQLKLTHLNFRVFRKILEIFSKNVYPQGTFTVYQLYIRLYSTGKFGLNLICKFNLDYAGYLVQNSYTSKTKRIRCGWWMIIICIIFCLLYYIMHLRN